MTNPDRVTNQVASRWLVRSWFGLVLIPLVLTVLVILIPNDGVEHLGVGELVVFGVLVALCVATLGLPLLIAAVVFSRRGR